MIKLRDYQQQASDSVFSYFENGNKGNPVIAMPTGTGKSIVIADIARRAVQDYKNQTIYVLTHVKELVKQNFSKLELLWPNGNIGIHSAGLNRRDIYCDVLFGGIASVKNSLDRMRTPTLIMVDEAHLVSPDKETMYRKVFDYFQSKNKHLKAIALSATPWRMGQGKITEEGGLFTDFCFDITDMYSFNRLISEGYLCPLVPAPMKTYLNADGVTMSGGDYNLKALQRAVNKDEITKAALEETLSFAYNRHKWLVFTSGIDHAENTSKFLTRMGVSNVCIHSKIGSKERDLRIQMFLDGVVTAAVNYGVLTTGFDCPDIDLIVMLRPTQSPGLWVQMLGRGTRCVYMPGFDLETVEGRLAAIASSYKQNCLVLDFARNSERLGPINDPVLPRKKGSVGGAPPIKACEACGIYNHISVRYCGGQPYPTTMGCGSEFLFEVKIQQEASTDELLKINDFPQEEVFNVEYVTYQKHEKSGAPPMVKVSYYTPLHTYREYLCFEHPKAKYRALKWWEKRNLGPPPETVDEALLTISSAQAPTQIRVIVNREYPEIIDHCFDGTSFGQHPPVFPPTPPHLLDDDIPF